MRLNLKFLTSSGQDSSVGDRYTSDTFGTHITQCRLPSAQTEHVSIPQENLKRGTRYIINVHAAACLQGELTVYIGVYRFHDLAMSVTLD